MQPASSEPSRETGREPAIVALVSAMRHAGIIGPRIAGGAGQAGVDAFARPILQAERACGAGLAVTEALVDASRDIDADDRAWRLAIAYPVAVCLAAAVGVIWLAAGLAPALEAVVREPGGSVGAGSEVAAAIGSPRPGRPFFQSLPTGLGPGILAAVAVPLAAAVGLRAARRARDARKRLRVRAVLGDVLERLLAAGCEEPLRGEILSSVAEAFGDGPAAGGPAAVARFRGSGAFERRLADAGRSRDRRLVPVLASLVAGVAVLAYGLTLVRPVVAMLERVVSVAPAAEWRPPR